MGWPALGDVYCNVGGVGPGRVSSSCTSGHRGPGLKRSKLTPGPGPEGTSNTPTTGGHRPAGPMTWTGFYSFELEPFADGTVALAQATWASSACPWCHQDRPDFVLLFPPHTLLRPALAKARLDRAQGIAIVPSAPTAAWWPPLMAASQTRVNNLKRQPDINARKQPARILSHRTAL
jgi:hypothetical protein